MTGDEGIAVTEDPRTGGSVLSLSGHITITAAGRLHRAAREVVAHNSPVTVRLDQVEHLDTAAVQVLLSLGRDLTARGRKCDLTGLGGTVRDTFRLAGLTGAGS